MSGKQNPQSQVPNGTSSTIITNGIPNDPNGAFRKLLDAMAVCNKHESFYTEAETTASALVKMRSQLEEVTEQHQKKISSYEDLLQHTSEHRRKMDEEREGLRLEKEKLCKELESHTAKLSQQKEAHAGLHQQIREQNQTLKEMANAVAVEKARSTGLDKALGAKADECKKVNANLRETHEELRKWRAYESELVQVSPRSFHEAVESIWEGAVTFAKKYFRVDVSSAILEKQKDWISEARKHYTFTKIPPFPASNSDAAKDMRMAVALAVFASLISRHILLPTYIRGGQDSLHSLLSDQAYDDDKASSLCRALLLSLLSPESQSEQINAALSAVCDDFYNFAGRLLLEPSQYGEFMIDLKSLISKVMDIWQGAQRSTVMFDAGLNVGKLQPWTGFGSSAPAKTPTTEDYQVVEAEVLQEDVVLFLFPGFIRTTTGSDDLVFSSMVLTKSQLMHVEEEYELEQRRAIGSAQRRPSGRRRDSVVRGSFLDSSP